MRDKYSVYFLSLLKMRDIKSIEIINFYEVYDEDGCHICFDDKELKAYARHPIVKKCWVFVSNGFYRTSFRPGLRRQYDRSRSAAGFERVFLEIRDSQEAGR